MCVRACVCVCARARAQRARARGGRETRGGREGERRTEEEREGERAGDLLSWASCSFFLSSSRSGSVGLRLRQSTPAQERRLSIGTCTQQAAHVYGASTRVPLGSATRLFLLSVCLLSAVFWLSVALCLRAAAALLPRSPQPAELLPAHPPPPSFLLAISFCAVRPGCLHIAY